MTDAPAASQPLDVQLSLTPEERPQGNLARIPLDHIDNPGSPLTVDFLQSVQDWGVLETVSLVVKAMNGPISEVEPRYLIADGKRRVTAAHKLGLLDVPAVVYPANTPLAVAAALTLVSNYQRSANQAAELEAMEVIFAQGGDEFMIANQLHMPIQTVRKRLALRNLIEPLRRAFDGQKITSAVAAAAAKLDAERQQELVRLLNENGTVTMEDVRGSKQVRAAQAVMDLPHEAFEDSPENPDNIVQQIRDRFIEVANLMLKLELPGILIFRWGILTGDFFKFFDGQWTEADEQGPTLPPDRPDGEKGVDTHWIDGETPERSNSAPESTEREQREALHAASKRKDLILTAPAKSTHFRAAVQGSTLADLREMVLALGGIRGSEIAIPMKGSQEKLKAIGKRIRVLERLAPTTPGGQDG